MAVIVDGRKVSIVGLVPGVRSSKLVWTTHGMLVAYAGAATATATTGALHATPRANVRRLIPRVLVRLSADAGMPLLSPMW